MIELDHAGTEHTYVLKEKKMDKDEIVKQSMERKRKYQETFRCLDCNVGTLPDPNHYSVHDNIWEEATTNEEYVGSEVHGDLCLRCLKTRLGRDLRLSDFMLEYPVNNHITQELLNKVNS